MPILIAAGTLTCFHSRSSPDFALPRFHDDQMSNLIQRTTEELLAELDGVSLEEHRRESQLRERLRQIGERYRGKPPSEWPNLTFNWDLRSESQRFALDGAMKPLEFSCQFPDGFALGYVDTREFDNALCAFNRRNLSELWEVGSESKLAYILAYLEEGLPITPPLVGTTTAKNELCLHGGNHRYTACKFGGLVRIPIYASATSQAMVSKLTPVCWVAPRRHDATEGGMPADETVTELNNEKNRDNR